MKSFVLVTACFLALISTSNAVIPKGYILQLNPYCGANGVDDAKIKIVTDLNADAVATCAKGNVVNFTSTDDVNFMLDVSYPSQGAQSCVFNKRKDADVFYLRVSVAYGEPGSLVHQYEEEYTVTCTFSAKGSDDSVNQTVVEGLIAPVEHARNMGANSGSTFTLELVDVLGQSLAGQNVSMGRTVQLKGTSSGTDGEAGLRPVSCSAIDGDAKYAILRAGCGDGIVFNKDVGFITNGTTTLSPYFKAFSINHGVIINFECSFVICTTNCDGCSCKTA